MSKYIYVDTPDAREMPGFKGKLAKWDRHRYFVLWRRLDVAFSKYFLNV